MPTYGYRCSNGHEFEVVHGMGDPPPTACEVCGATAVTRVFYPISISFTGSGFYATDYGRSGQKPEAGVEQKSDAAAPSGSGAETSAKSGKKTDAKTTKKCDPDQKA